jgi:hypothetical protein
MIDIDGRNETIWWRFEYQVGKPAFQFISEAFTPQVDQREVKKIFAERHTFRGRETSMTINRVGEILFISADQVERGGEEVEGEQ